MAGELACTGRRCRPNGRSSSVVSTEAQLEIGSDAYITLVRDRKAPEKIDIYHGSPPSPRLRGTPFALGWCAVQTFCGGEKVACHPKLWRQSRAKGGGADRDRTDDLLNAIRSRGI